MGVLCTFSCKDAISFKLTDIVGGDSREFTIGTDGKIHKLKSFDYEQQRLFFFGVQISDGPAPLSRRTPKAVTCH